ncbi:MAG: hypothetical protein FJ271_25025 [Planctomycetes bacterium]|nr:hypothetical protein [Planctomycetota bacterium]
MLATLTIEEAQSKLKQVIDNLGPGEEVLIMDNLVPVAKLIGRPQLRQARVPGTCKGMITLAVEDEEHLKDFREYMP